MGYTNAGKSTLFRALTGADAYVADQLFATLDPTVRRIMLPGNTPVVVADTVGFIRELPHELVAAFQSTLTEAREATLLLHVVDVSDPRRDEHIDEVNRVLAEIGAARPAADPGVQQDRPHRHAAAHRARRIRAREPRVAVRGQGRRASICCSNRWPSAWRASRAARRCACRSRPASCGRGCMPADLVRAERIADDGAFEIDTELSEFELLKWAREPGVEVLTLAGDSTCTAAGAYLQSSPALAKQLTMAWNQPGSPNNNPWGKKPAPGGGDLDQAFKDWQKRIESLFGGGGRRLGRRHC